MNFPFVDFTIAAIVIIAIVVGIKRGFFKSLLRLVSFSISVLFTYLLTGGILKVCDNWFGTGIGGSAILEVIFRLVIIIVLFAIFEAVIGFFERRIMRGRSDIGSAAVGKLLGMSVGFVKAVFIIIVGLTLISSLFPGENQVTAEINVSVVGRFLFEKNPFPTFVELYLL